MVLYEFPFNESIRTMLRLEHLFKRLSQLVARDHAVDHHFALATMFEIMDVASRADLKSDLLKDLEGQKARLTAYRGNPAVSEAMLDDVIGRIDEAFQGLNKLNGKAGHALLANEWLISIRSRINIPGGTCEFDLPGYYYWQQLPPDQRRRDLINWSTTLTPLAQALNVLLNLLRDSGNPHKVVAVGGTFQQSLSNGKTYQLLRLRLPLTSGLVPEITGHRLQVSVRMMRQDTEGRLRPTLQDADFELTLCQ